LNKQHSQFVCLFFVIFLAQPQNFLPIDGVRSRRISFHGRFSLPKRLFFHSHLIILRTNRAQSLEVASQDFYFNNTHEFDVRVTSGLLTFFGPLGDIKSWMSIIIIMDSAELISSVFCL
jgi:hypothetical protein